MKQKACQLTRTKLPQKKKKKTEATSPTILKTTKLMTTKLMTTEATSASTSITKMLR
jgi:hypothetical protein